MGLFNFLKKKENEKPSEESKEIIKDNKEAVLPKIEETPSIKEPVQEVSELQNQPIAPLEEVGEKQEYYGDLHKTGHLIDLCETPIDKRDEAWMKDFLANVPQASFKCGDPQVITGPDGFPYFQLSFPEPGVQFQCYVVDNMVYDFLLSNGLGIVINPQKEQPDWVFTYGDVFNYGLKKDFYNTDNTFFNKNHPQQDEKIKEDVQVMVGAPSDFILPQPVRAVVKNFLQFKGIKQPKVLLMSKEKDGEQIQDLVFNFTPKDFEKDEDFRTTAEQLMWFLPRHYSVIFYDENESLNGHFEDL